MGVPSTNPLRPRRRLSAAALVVFLVPLAGGAQSDDRARTEVLARQATDRMRALQQEADALAREERTILGDLRRLEIERQLKEEEVQRIEVELAAASKQLQETNARIATLQASVNNQRPSLEARLVDLYKLGRGGYLRLLLNVSDVRELGRAYRMISALEARDRAQVTEHRETLERLHQERVTLGSRSEELARLHARGRRARVALDRAVASRESLVETIDNRRDLNAQLAGELQQAQQKLQASLTGLADRSDAPIALPLRPFRGVLAWPAAGKVTATFGRDRRTNVGIVRNGIEIAAPDGQPVRAVHDGRVAYADVFAGFGTVVIVEHGDDNYSLYGHLASAAVQKGAAIETGGLVGTVGRSPAGAPSLYFELRIDGKPVDPVQWLKRAPAP